MKQIILLQLCFWLILGGIAFGFSSNIMPVNVAILLSLTNLLIYGLAFYGNSLFIFPKFYNPSKIGKFVFLNIICILICAFLLTEIESTLFSQHMYFPRKYTPPFSFRALKNVFWLLFIIVLSSIFLIQKRLTENEERNKNILEEKLNTELKLLKAQINPHFLFNALNNVYSLSYLKSDKAPESVLKLSGMLRYVIEDCVNETVLITSELEYIDNFIAFQEMKSPDKLNITTDYEQVNSNIRIAPLLFVPFIENSFKYSKVEEFQNAYIKIKIWSGKDKEIEFSIKNSIPAGEKVKSGAGTGIKNVKQRLNIIYPEKHELKITETETEYSVLLKIFTQ